jgi:hypothetical protein
MSPFARLVSIIMGVISILYLFTNTTFLEQPPKQKINKEKIIKYVNEQVNYELTYGEKKSDAEIKLLIDQALIYALKQK